MEMIIIEMIIKKISERSEKLQLLKRSRECLETQLMINERIFF